MAFEHTLRRWAREHEVSWAAFPIDERQGGRDLRVGYTLLLHARAKGDPPRPPGAGTLSTPETRVRALSLCLLGGDHRVAEYHSDCTETPPAARSSLGQPRQLVLTLRVRFRPEYVVPASLAGAEPAGEVGHRLRALGAPERP